MKNKILPRKFYQRDTVTVAKDLIGKILVRNISGKILSGVIVETEAYSGLEDPASHAYIGETKRNMALFGPVGHAYIYFTYGNHFCLNVVAKKNVKAGGVLIRAIFPLQEIEEMQKNRYIKNLKTLTNGPGKITQALKIDKELYGTDLTKKGPLYICDTKKIKESEIHATPRIGIKKAKDNPWRFVVKKLK